MSDCNTGDRKRLFFVVEKRRSGWPAEQKQDTCSPFSAVTAVTPVI